MTPYNPEEVTVRLVSLQDAESETHGLLHRLEDGQNLILEVLDEIAHYVPKKRRAFRAKIARAKRSLGPLNLGSREAF